MGCGRARAVVTVLFVVHFSQLLAGTPSEKRRYPDAGTKQGHAPYIKEHAQADERLAQVSGFRRLAKNETGLQPFIYHLHIDKTGGTTIKHSHSEIFPNWTSCNARHNVDFSDDSAGVQRMLASPRFERGDCNVLSYEGHYSLRFPLQMEYLSGRSETLVATFVREPVQHMLSKLMQRMKIRHLTDPGVFWEDVAPNYGDRMKRALSLPSEDADIATARLNGLFFVGLTEFYGLSMCVLAYQLGDWVSANHVDKYCSCPSIVVPKNTAPVALAKSTNVSVEMVKQISVISRVDAYVYTRAAAIFWARVDEVSKVLRRDLLCLDGVS